MHHDIARRQGLVTIELPCVASESILPLSRHRFRLAADRSTGCKLRVAQCCCGERVERQGVIDRARDYLPAGDEPCWRRNERSSLKARCGCSRISGELAADFEGLRTGRVRILVYEDSLKIAER